MKLYGVALSNYYNIVKLALLEKGFSFEEVFTPPSQEHDLLEKSPMGKIPFLQEGDHFVSESQAILFYLELRRPTPRLYPRDPWLGARAQQIHQFVDLYIDQPARTLAGAAFFGGTASEEEVQQIGQQLRRNVDALGRLVTFNPYIAGPELTHADLAAYMTFGFAQLVMERLHGPDPLTHLPGVGAYLQLLSERSSFRQVLEDQQAAMSKLEKRARE